MHFSAYPSPIWEGIEGRQLVLESYTVALKRFYAVFLNAGVPCIGLVGTGIGWARVSVSTTVHRNRAVQS